MIRVKAGQELLCQWHIYFKILYFLVVIFWILCKDKLKFFLVCFLKVTSKLLSQEKNIIFFWDNGIKLRLNLSTENKIRKSLFSNLKKTIFEIIRKT